jgi:hypothetical protein
MNSKDFSRLGPAAQKQVLQKLGKQQRGRETKTPGKNKYNAKPTDVIMPDGTVRHFSSEKEAKRFRSWTCSSVPGDHRPALPGSL